MRGLAFGLLVLAPAVASATPHDLPYSYPYATLPQGSAEIEQYTDLTPVPAVTASGSPDYTPLFILTTEVEYGLTDKLELGLYFQGSDNPGVLNGGPSEPSEAPLNFDGIKQRLRYRIAEPGELPVDISVYGELSELQTEIELEGKVNLERDFGPVQVLVNLWGERELYFDGLQQWVLNPTAGASYEITPALHVGLEYWGHGEWGGGVGASFNNDFHSFLGPALMFQSAHFWVAAAPYLRLDRMGYAAQLGDQFGAVWVRTIIGYQF